LLTLPPDTLAIDGHYAGCYVIVIGYANTLAGHCHYWLQYWHNKVAAASLAAADYWPLNIINNSHKY